MSSYQAIGDVGRTIIKVLKQNLTPEPIPKQEMIELCAPYEESDFRLTLYLYSIVENSINRDCKSSLISLNLYYLVTAFSKAELKTKAYEESCILGKVAQTFQQNPIIRGSDLEGTLAESNNEIKTMFHQISPDEMSKIWTFPNAPCKLSLAYMIGPVNIYTNDGSAVSNRVLGR